ncbi:MAG: hypothetical protein CR972_04965 [Candidatus Moraniibacteriota bacterium]|nr:MAG: hypothetical protein CR972_04965 [Candidatus Moranbacteria bacterium]
MKTKDIMTLMNDVQKKDFQIARSLILLIVLYAAIALLSGVFGVFYTSGIWITWASLSILFYIKKIVIFSRPSQELISYTLIALAFSLLIAIYTVPTIFSGRDQGSLSAAAMQLSNTHHLITHTPESTVFFNIYGYGKALNFPGFFYTADGGLLTQFPLPYITYIAGFFGIFGIYGFVVANFTLLSTFIISITLFARNFINTKYTFVFLTLFLSSFCISWFAKFTLSENITSMLLWSTALLFVMLKKNPEKTTYFTFFITLSLILFSRLEGLWFFAIFTFLTFRSNTIRTFLRKDIWWYVIFPFTVLFTIGCVVFTMNVPFITTIANVFLNTTVADGKIGSESFLEKFSYLVSVYGLYGLIGPLIFTAGLSAIAMRYKKYRRYLLPITVTLPLFSYYLFPHISSDHPWMLRRFTFALLPATLLVSTFFIAAIPRRWSHMRPVLQYTIITILLLANIPAFATFITYAENTTLKNQIHNLSTLFSDNDLILIDKNVTGNGWSMITSPLRSLENKHAVYFFNTSDYEKIDVSKFKRVFLITPNTNKEFYETALHTHIDYTGKFIFTSEQLQLENSKTIPTQYPKKDTYIIRCTIYELNNLE